MNQLRAMLVLSRVAERGSLTAASIDLGYARGAASAIVSELERYLGVQLLERSTRSLRLTEDGQAYLDGARRILADVAELEASVGSAERIPRGVLRVQIPAGLARLVVAPSLHRFIADYPEIEVQILSRNSLPNFTTEQIDAAVFVGPLPSLDIIARPIGRLPYLTAAAPGYLARNGTPERPADLADHTMIGVLSSTTGQRIPFRFRESGADLDVVPEGPLAFETAEAAVAAATGGAGIVQLASYLVYNEVRAGKLVPILDAARPASAEMNVIHARHRLKPRKLRVFEDFLRDLNLRTRKSWGVKVD
jgi:LysR family transcriptional regulator for bpeEF and oprC